MKKKRTFFAIIALQFFFVIAVTFPAIFHLSDKIIGDGGDNYEYLTYQYLTYRNLVEGKLPFAHTNYLFYPNGFDLSLVDGQLVNLAGGVVNFFLDPIVTYNVLVLVVFMANGLVAYVFFSSLFDSKKHGLLASLIYAYSYQRISLGGGFLNLLPAYGFLVVGYSLLKLFKQKDTSWQSFSLFFIGLFLTAVSSLQSFLMLIVALGVLLILFGLLYQKKFAHFFRSTKNGIKIFVCAVLFLLVFLIWFGNYLQLFMAHQFPQRSVQSQPLSLSAYLFPNAYSPTVLGNFLVYLKEKTAISLLSKEGLSVDKNVFFGFVEIGLLLFFLLKKSKSKFDWFMAANFGVLFILSLGKVRFLPNSFLYDWWPFSGIYEGWRLFSIYSLFLTYGVVAAVGHLSTHFKKEWIFWLAFSFIFLERISLNYYLSDTLKDTYHSFIRSLPGEAVVHFPLEYKVATSNNLFIIYDQKKIVDGYTHWAAESLARRSFLNFDNELRRFYCDFRQDTVSLDNRLLSLTQHQALNQKMLKRLLENRIEYIAVNKNFYASPNCAEARIAGQVLFSMEPAYLMKIYEDDNATIYKIRLSD